MLLVLTLALHHGKLLGVKCTAGMPVIMQHELHSGKHGLHPS